MPLTTQAAPSSSGKSVIVKMGCASIFFVVTGVAIWLATAYARSIHDSPPNMWRPESGSADKLYKYHGFSRDEWAKTVLKLHQLKTMVAIQSGGIAYDAQALDAEPKFDQQNERLDACIWLTKEQVDELIEEEKDHARHSRKKRTIDQSAFLRWKMPIHWKFDGNHTTSERRIIREAFQQWEDTTCARFRELGTNERFSDHHVLITRSGQGCYSFVGRVAPIPQQLNLHAVCLKEIGTPVHEIGHVLGLWHEQQRSDRDDSIKILWKNVGFLAGQFFKRRTDNMGVPYNVGSVMHYGPKSGSKNGENTMEAIDNEYQPNMGQRVELSFSDAKIINLAYCKKTCSYQLPRPCMRSGYQDPNNCHKCRCPFGFSGTYCERVEPSKNARCGGEIQATNTPTTIQSPGYDSPKHYDSRQQCNWLITAPANHQVVLKFEDEFGVYCHTDDRCYHWVEVRHGKDIGLQGPRHCCYKRPDYITTSFTNEMMVMFKSNWDVPWSTAKRGFRATVIAVPKSGYHQPPSTKAPELRTNPPPAPRPTPSACAKTDLAFLIDSSTSVTADEWTKMTSFVSRFVADLTTGPDCVRVSVVTFGDKPKMHFDLRAHGSLQDLEALLKDVGRNRHTTDIAGGLQMARNSVFKWSRGDRSGVPNVCVVMTDGQSASGDKSNARTKAREARNAGIEVFAVGIGSAVDTNELNDIAGSSRHVVLVNSFNSLGDQSTLSRLHKAVFNNAAMTTTKPSSRTTTATTTTATTTTTTTTPTPPLPTGTSSVNWACTFEDSDGNKTLCDMTQSTNDNFDWTLTSGSTPSGETGPDSAYNDPYYVFIEASTPRSFGDRAGLYVPQLGTGGKYCVRFNYHMYGYHIYKLQLVKKNTWGDVKELWFRSYDLGKKWWEAAVTVDIKSTDRIGFVGVRGHEYSGDIALDNIRIRSGQC